MRLFDLHCDTLYRAYAENSSLSDARFEINITKAKKLERYTQLTAIWIPDEYRGEAAVSLFRACESRYRKERLFSDTHRMVLSVEGGAVLGGRIENIAMLRDAGVTALTLTWNGENELGGGAHTDFGLTPFGKTAVRLLEENRIAVDISHASDHLLYDVFETAEKPVIATHSNARRVADNRRNLTDEQFSEIVRRGGIVGLTYHNAFLNTDPEKARAEDLLRHAYHFLSLGGEDALALGSDFDGGELPADMHGLEDMTTIHQMFLKEFGMAVTDKIFFENAERYFGFS